MAIDDTVLTKNYPLKPLLNKTKLYFFLAIFVDTNVKCDYMIFF